MLAGTVVFVYAGSSVLELPMLADNGIGVVFTPKQLSQIVLAFVLLGLFPLIVRYTLNFVHGDQRVPVTA
ncbi:MAG: hypothetical protein HKN47_01775 [Pirellulaceae bacterium]|nr:hypothetical protein [Pirellulaceae bacterium]